MRHLTPAERRELEVIKRLTNLDRVVFEDANGNNIYLNMTRRDDRDFWLTVLDLALVADDQLKSEWRKYDP